MLWDFQKIFENFDLFLSRPNCVFWRALPLTVIMYWRPFLGTFWKTLKKNAFFGARSPSPLLCIGAEGTFRKILGLVGQKRIS